MAIFLLGADDPEMQAIAKLLDKMNFSPQFATAEGKRVHAGNAYKADPLDLIKGELLVCIECRPTSVQRGIELIVIDHHRPGDPGWDKGAKEYWEASSIGQLHKLLHIPPSHEAQVLAAMDHCFPAAMRGECPGVTDKEVLECKVSSIASAHNADAASIRQTIDYFRHYLCKNSTVRIGDSDIVDMRTFDLGVGYSLKLLCAQVAVTLENKPALLHGKNTIDSPVRITLYGADPATTTYFMTKWAPANRLVDIYGVPERGYAGGHVRL